MRSIERVLGTPENSLRVYSAQMRHLRDAFVLGVLIYDSKSQITEVFLCQKREQTPSKQRKKQKRRGISRLAKKAAPQSTQKAKEWRDFCAKRGSESAVY